MFCVLCTYACGGMHLYTMYKIASIVIVCHRHCIAATPLTWHWLKKTKGGSSTLGPPGIFTHLTGYQAVSLILVACFTTGTPHVEEPRVPPCVEVSLTRSPERGPGCPRTSGGPAPSLLHRAWTGGRRPVQPCRPRRIRRQLPDSTQALRHVHAVVAKRMPTTNASLLYNESYVHRTRRPTWCRRGRPTTST